MGWRSRVLLWLLLVGAALAVSIPSTAAADSLEVSATPALYPAFDQAVTDYVVRCSAGTPLDLSVSAPSGTAVDVDGQGSRTGDFTARVSLSEGQAFVISATAGPGQTAYRVRCLPADFPAWTFQRSGSPQAEWYAAAPVARTDFGPVPPEVSPAYTAMFDTNGVPVWWMKTPDLSLNFSLLPNGEVSWNRMNGSGNEVRRLDGSLDRVVRAIPEADAHDMLLLPNGNYVVLGVRVLDNFDPCGQSNVPIRDEGVQEIAPDGSVVWEWWASDHIAMSEIPAAWCDLIIATGATGYDVTHINSVERDGDGYLISFRHLDAVYRVSRADGSIDWKLGGTARPESLNVVNDPLGADPLRGQHDARVLGDGTVTVHDNGYHQSSSRPPRAVRYAIDSGARTATLVEQVNDPGDVATPLCCGSARKLSGGDWVMSWGSAGVITELTPAGSRVFSLTFDDNLFSYRAQPIPYGQLSRASLVAGMDARFPRGYARARGADKVRTALVPAFKSCLSPDTNHGAPLASSSCGSPAGTSSFLTVGTADANGQPSKATGFVAYMVKKGNTTTPEDEADVSLRVTLSDVRRRADLSDYTGEVQLRQGMRVTDRLNGSLQNEAATGLDLELPATVPCAATADAAVGATCSLASSFDALVPGSVVESKRSTWELGPVRVFDGGASGTAGASGAALFETQGLFVP